MRQQLIEALLYPRKMLEELIEEGNATVENGFEYEGETYRIQDFQHLDQASEDDLSASLREGIKLVESLHRHLRHDETTSTSEYCNWIRNAEHLVEEAEHHLPHVDPPGVVHPD